MVATTAAAATPQHAPTSVAAARGTTLTDAATASLTLSPQVRVPADINLDLGDITATSTPAPEPEPEPEPEPFRPTVQATSRTLTNRTPTTGTTAAPTATTAPTATATTDPAPAPATSNIGDRIVAIAKQYVGVPYVYGGSTPSGFDCSGFTQYVYARAGITIPRSSASQHVLGGVVPASAAPPGALMTWDGHAGIYLGGGMHIAARNPGTPLSISPIYRDGARYHVLW